MEERIYVGGLDSSRLSADEVVKRIESIPELRIRSVDVGGNHQEGSGFSTSGCFFHIQARSTDETVSPFSIIHKLYHNVKWKGCKLRVELAKPHFLERLKQERQQVLQSKSCPSKEQSQDEKLPSILRRHLRIQKKFGHQETIDTKPFRVVDWSSFHKVLKKRTFTKNRSVHMRFDQQQQDSIEGDSGIEASSSSESSQSSSREQEQITRVEDSTDSSTSNNEEGTGTYQWSSSSDDDSSTTASSLEEDELPGDGKTAEQHLHEKPVPLETREGTGASSLPLAEKMTSFDQGNERGNLGARDEKELHEEDRDEEFALTRKEEDLQRKDKSPSYDWASTSSSSQSDSESKQHTEESSRSEELTENEQNHMDLETEVTSNLHLLSTLFPDLQTTTQAATVMEKGESATANAIMPRYDPSTVQGPEDPPPAKKTSSSVEQEVLADDGDGVTTSRSDENNIEKDYIEKESESGDDGQTENSEQMELKDGAENEKQNSEQGTKESKDVYEEKKLEEVFRTARMGSVATAPSEPGNGGGVFSFSFQLGTNEETSGGSGGFSFGFDVGGGDTKQTDAVVPTTDVTCAADGSSTNIMVQPAKTESIVQTKEPVFRRRGFFPNDVLNEYVKEFYALNDGRRVMEDPEGFATDEGVREHWHKERQALTLDWKRKKKNAQSRATKRRRETTSSRKS